MSKEELLGVLRGLIQETLRARFDGGAYAKLSRVNGYADGYMRALLDAGIADDKSLMLIVGDERARFLAGHP